MTTLFEEISSFDVRVSFLMMIIWGLTLLSSQCGPASSASQSQSIIVAEQRYQRTLNFLTPSSSGSFAMTLTSPARRLLFELHPLSNPFGPGHCYDDGTGLNNQVLLYLGCGDLRKPLSSLLGAIQSPSRIHINNKDVLAIARQILILKIISSPNFDSEDELDMSYIMDVWYNANWGQPTLVRFIQDVHSLFTEPLPDSIVIPKSSYKKDLEDVWTEWLSTVKTKSVKAVLAERRDVMVKYGMRNLIMNDNQDEPMVLSFSEVADQVTKSIEAKALLNGPHIGSNLTGLRVRQEVRQYFLTGNHDGKVNGKASVNPTFLQPVTDKWIVPFGAYPFEGFFPIPSEELTDGNKTGSGIISGYGQKELKKLLIAFRKRMDGLKFVFHPCDALTFCYEDSTGGFDVIDTSSLVDYVGLANLLNAAGRKLHSDRSVLFAERTFWPDEDLNAVHYVQEALCCPLSLIPTLYGLRLIMDNVQLGSESIPPYVFSGGTLCRLRWKKALPFDGVPLVLSPALERSLKLLRTTCFAPDPDMITALFVGYTPLTFRYVLSDLIRRGGSSDLMEGYLRDDPPIFRESLEASQAWMDQRPVWRVTYSIPFNPMDQMLYDRAEPLPMGIPILRLVLIPARAFVRVAGFLSQVPSSSGRSLLDELCDPNSEENHIVDNLELDLKRKPDGGIETVGITFLLKDLDLLKTHVGIVFDAKSSFPFFIIGVGCGRPLQVEPFNRPYPWVVVTPGSSSSLPDEPRTFLIGQDCQESEVGYKIRLKIHPGGGDIGQVPSGLKVTTDNNDELQKLRHCQSAHRITVSLDGVEPLTITLPWPVLPNTLKATLRRKDCIVEIVVDKVLNDLWPEDVLHNVDREVPSSSALFTSTPLVARCGACGKSAGHLKRCSRCKAVSYCSVECQRAAWKGHKLSCSKV